MLEFFRDDPTASGDDRGVRGPLRFGLNTVVPFGDPTYYRARPGIGIAENRVVKLDDHVGLHPNLDALRPAWDGGDLAVVQGVGYEPHQRSPSLSPDI